MEREKQNGVGLVHELVQLLFVPLKSVALNMLLYCVAGVLLWRNGLYRCHDKHTLPYSDAFFETWT